MGFKSNRRMVQAYRRWHDLIGGTPAFSPLDLSNLYIWLKSDTGLYQDAAMTTPAASDGDVVGGWADQSGNGEHVTQAVAADKPLLKTGANGINNRSVVLWDGIDDYLESAVFAALNQPNHFVFVGRQVTWTDTDRLFDGGAATQQSLVQRLGADRVSMNAGAIGPTLSPASEWPTGAAAIVECLFDGVDSSMIIDNGVPLLGNAGANAMTQIRLGCRGDITNFGNWDVAEWILVNGEIPANELDSLRSYLAKLYNITLF